MAILKKGSRQIVVEGTTYRWRGRHKPTYSQANAWTNFVLAVELAEVGGSTLLVDLSQAHPSNWMGEPVVPALPSDVELYVRKALTAGWHPSEEGQPFQMLQSALQEAMMSVKERIYQLVDALPEEEVLHVLEDLERQHKQVETPKTGILALDAALVKMGETAPREDLEKIPTDLSEQHDHYIYGTPKR